TSKERPSYCVACGDSTCGDPCGAQELYVYNDYCVAKESSVCGNDVAQNSFVCIDPSGADKMFVRSVAKEPLVCDGFVAEEPFICGHQSDVEEFFVHNNSSSAKEPFVCDNLHSIEKPLVCGILDDTEEEFFNHNQASVYDFAQADDNHQPVIFHDQHFGVHDLDEVNIDDFNQEMTFDYISENHFVNGFQETEADNGSLHQIVVGMVFESWEKIDKWLKFYALEQGNGDNIAEFALAINNPIEIKTKGRPKGSNHVNINKDKRKQAFSSSQNSRANKIRRPWKVLGDIDLNGSESSKNNGRKCGICNVEGHNTRTCHLGN
ncbi:27219_t:CDS:2, partial [Racocetra persica]